MNTMSLPPDRCGIHKYFLATSKVIVALTAFISIILLASNANAQQSSESEYAVARASSKVKVAVIGDSLALELWKGLHKAGRRNKNVRFIKFTRVSTGLVRRDVFNWNAHIRKVVRSNDFDIAVVVMGGNDRQSAWVNKRRVRRGSKAWFREYARRADGFMKTLSRSGKPVYWVGLPIVRSAQMSRDYRQLNSLFRRLAGRHGFHYVDTWRAFSDRSGRYTSYGRDSRGAKRRMRNNDGLHFSSYGRLKFGRFVYQHLRRELGRLGAS